MLRFLSEADVIKIESEVPARILQGFLERRGRPDLARRVEVIPFAVRPCFTEPRLPDRKEDLVIVAGRLGDVQKGPVETAAALRAFLRNGGPTRVEIHSRGIPDSSLLALADEFRTVTVRVDSPRELLADRLRAAAVLFSRARWETTPVIALEALCSGCTVVAPRELPGFASLLEDGRFGKLYPRERTRDAVEALREETGGWRTGARVPRALASKWRQDVSVTAVALRLAMRAVTERSPHSLVA
jgi:glycosyltransferase involved in cell wall biosynthesis